MIGFVRRGFTFPSLGFAFPVFLFIA